ncbi:MAG: amidohydrolase [Henriciella sp.]|nr:amidohydrolase [Henriciella sp.]
MKTAPIAALTIALAACGQTSAPTAPAPPAPASVPEATTASHTSGPVEMTADMPTAGTNLHDLYLYLHSNPELSFKEIKTSAILANELTSLGFEVTTGLGDAWTRAKSMRDYGTVVDGVGGYGVVGVLRNGDGPTVMIRTDMDALPVAEQTGLAFASQAVDETWTGVSNGVMHACGHDIHMTSWVGTARELIASKEQWSGTLVMIAQPAEELGNGAQAMIKDGLFTRFPTPDYNLGLHVSAGLQSGKVGYSSGFALANVDSVDITVKGVGGHGAYPHTTKDPVVVASAIVMALQTLVARNVDPQIPAVVTVGSFQAGAKHNIISAEAKLLLTVRSYDDDTRTLLLEGIARIAKAQAVAFGAPEPTIFIEPDYTPATYNDPDLAARAATAIGGAIGADNVAMLTPVMGGEDFAQYSRTAEKIPSLIFWIGAVEPERWQQAQDGTLDLPSLHSPFFSPDYQPTIATGVKSMTAAATALFNKE